MAVRLKVFITSDGLTDFIVAAGSRPKALAAWGTHQDLFKSGAARETQEPDLVAAATRAPGQVLRRPTGASGKPAPQPKAKKAQPAPSKPSKAALAAVARAEARVASISRDQDAAFAALAARRAKLEAEEQQTQEDFARRAAEAAEALSAARRRRDA